jgi:hypothetical protein
VAKKIKPQEVATQFSHDATEIADFCADALEDANDHNLAAALRAVNVQQYDLACEFITLEKDHQEAGELTPELRDRREALLARLREAAQS